MKCGPGGQVGDRRLVRGGGDQRVFELPDCRRQVGREEGLENGLLLNVRKGSIASVRHNTRMLPHCLTKQTSAGSTARLLECQRPTFQSWSLESGVGRCCLVRFAAVISRMLPFSL